MKLTEIINEDYKIIEDKEISYKDIFYDLSEDMEDELNFYSERRKYYNFFGPNCSIYTLIKIFENNKDKIPEYSQVLIDEFQDFNKLESRLIELLAEKNSIIIAGDDDQSLYSFKSARPEEIRKKHESENYDSFELPFCSRCSEVIIDSFHDVIKSAKEKGFLKDRIEKEYKYFPSPEKDLISTENNKLDVKKGVFQTQIAYNIDKEIKNIFNFGKTDFSVLVICPLNSQIEKIEKALRKKGFANIQSPQKKKENVFIDGLKLLQKDEDCNLGWRIVSKILLEDRGEDINDVVKKSYTESNKKFYELLNKKDIAHIKSLLSILKKIDENKKLKEKEYNKIIECLNYDPREITLEQIKDDFNDINKKKNYKNIPIKITTILGSKGLTSDYVFLANFDDKYIIGQNNDINDENICKFLVALTRAKNKIFIYANDNKLPTFVSWINRKNTN